MKLSGSQCHWHHLYILKWKERKDLPYYRRKSQMCLLSSAEWNELNILNAELHFDYCLRKESRKQPPIPTQAPLHFFFLYLLLKQMRPIVGNFCAALNASIVTLPEINAFNLPLWYIWDTIQQPVRSSKPCSKSYGVRHSTVSTEPAGRNFQEAQETWERIQCFQIPSPSSREGH